MLLNLSGIYNIDLIFTWQRTCWLFLDVHVHPHNQKNRVTVCVHYHTLSLAVTRSSKFWSLTCVSAVKTFHFCHFRNSFLSTENAKNEWQLSKFTIHHVRMEVMIENAYQKEAHLKNWGFLHQGCKHLRQSFLPGKCLYVSPSWIFGQQLIYFGGQDDRTVSLCCQQ